MIEEFFKVVIRYESVRRFEALKRIGNLLVGKKRTHHENKIYWAVLDEMSIVYYSLSPDMRKQLRIEHPTMHTVFDMFDKEEFSGCEREECREECKQADDTAQEVH